ncbi:hypothetical protein ACIHFC_26730 [Streptomyces sp. NPDC052013]|uniref:hypothetical protein n=1 Tax=Streptomyces sp. NPDC052013 TaxID=3365679 RepID=UPI0037D7581E
MGYVVGYALAEEHLRQGLAVIAEPANPPAVTRDAALPLGEVDAEELRGSREFADLRAGGPAAVSRTPGLPLTSGSTPAPAVRTTSPGRRGRG